MGVARLVHDRMNNGSVTGCLPEVVVPGIGILCGNPAHWIVEKASEMDHTHTCDGCQVSVDCDVMFCRDRPIKRCLACKRRTAGD